MLVSIVSAVGAFVAIDIYRPPFVTERRDAGRLALVFGCLNVNATFFDTDAPARGLNATVTVTSNDLFLFNDVRALAVNDTLAE